MRARGGSFARPFGFTVHPAATRLGEDAGAAREATTDQRVEPKQAGLASDKRLLGGLLIFAFALRLEVAALYPYTIHPDEIFQVTEQAYRLVYHQGIVPWEFRQGVRGWVWPGTIAGLIWLLKAVTQSAAGIALVVAAFCCALSLATVLTGYLLGRQVSRAHAIVGGFVAAIWVEFVYFAAHPLTEVVAADFLLAALYLMTIASSRRRAFLAGLCLGLCFIMRFHLVPGLAVGAIWYARGKIKRRWLPLMAGAALPLAVYGAVDWLAWGAPFASIYNNFHANIVDERSRTYGTAPLWAYFDYLVLNWSGAFAVLAALVGIGARRYPMWLAVALTIFVSHSLIAHKEYRFIFPAVACFITLAAIGAGDVIAFVMARARDARLAKLALPGALILFAATSLSIALSAEFRPLWFRGRAAIEAFDWAGHRSELCGLGLYGVPSLDTPGYSTLHRDVPIYQDNPADSDEGLSHAYNFVLGTPRAVLPPAFRLAKCFGDGDARLCFYRRAGSCEPMPARTINRQLIDHDE